MPAKSAFAASATALALAVAGAMAAPSLALAQGLPTGGEVVSGSGSIGAPTGAALAINQNSHRMAIDWQQFNIGAGNTVRFQQPGADAVALNRVLGPDASQIMGQLQANGRVFLINPNGVLFGHGAQVDVGGLVASTLNISNADFMAGNYRFRADGASAHPGLPASSVDSGQGGPAAVVNHGRITAADGGAVALLGGQVHNQGVIQARMGTVALAAGNAVTLDFAGDGLLNVQIDQAAKNALVDNGHLIQADGGQVLMTAHASDALLQTVVNNTGVVEARTLQNREGKIVLLGDFSGGTVKVNGKLDASAPDGGDGGFIDTSGAYVQVADGVQVTTYAPQGNTGTWLIDPTDFTVGAGSGSKTGSGIGAATLAASLQNSSVELKTIAEGAQAGDIHVNAPIRWSANDRTLTLTAHRDININADIAASGDRAGLILNHGSGRKHHFSGGAKVTLAGANPIFRLNGAEYSVIRDMAQLQAIENNLGGRYVLGKSLDHKNQGFPGLGGKRGAPFTGVFDGLGNTISNLQISLGLETSAGLFAVNRGAIRNVGVLSSTVSGYKNVGGLVGLNEYGGSINNSYVSAGSSSGMVRGDAHVGGLVGLNDGGGVSNSYASVPVLGGEMVGGLIGTIYAGRVENNYATGNVTGYHGMLGGLVGANRGTNIKNSYATGNVSADGSGTAFVGGLVGENWGSVTDSHATGDVTGVFSVGGLVGLVRIGQVSNSYATGAVKGQNKVGGLVGELRHGAVRTSFATGSVSGSKVQGSVGGLVGAVGEGGQGLISDSYAMGGVTGGSFTYTGGLVGRLFRGSIVNSYATGGVVRANGGSRALVGTREHGTVSNSYWDTQTAGVGDPLGHGRTTQVLQQGLPPGFNPSVWGIVPGSSYPYLLHQFANGATPQVVAGKVTTLDGAGAGANIVVNGRINGGTLVSALTGGGVHTGANGYYYYLLQPGTIGANTALLTYVDAKVGGQAFKGVSFVDTAGGSRNNLDIVQSVLTMRTSAPSWTAALDNLNTAAGAGGQAVRTMAINLPNVRLIIENTGVDVVYGDDQDRYRAILASTQTSLHDQDDSEGTLDDLSVDVHDAASVLSGAETSGLYSINSTGLRLPEGI